MIGNEIFDDGMLQGEIRTKKSMARNLVKMGLSIEQIAQAANVSVEQVKQWLQESAPTLV